MEEIFMFKRIKEGDKKALEDLFHLHYRSLCSYLLQFTESQTDAEDIAQSVFITIWSGRDKINIKSSLKSYLYTTAYHLFVDRIRGLQRERKILQILKQKALSDQIEIDETVWKRKIERTKTIIDGLPPRCKEVLLLSKREGFKNREIADKLKISIKTVEAQLSIAFQRIREGFKEGDLYLFFLK